MEKYHVVGLTNNQVGRGALSLIMDVIRQEFWDSSQRALKRGVSAGTNQAIIRFENFLTTNQFPPEYEEFGEVLYLNPIAKALMDRRGIQLTVIKEVTEVPDDAGWLISMPIYS